MSGHGLDFERVLRRRELYSVGAPRRPAQAVAARSDLDFVLADTVRLIEQLRNEGRTVLLHCVACQSRTPTVAALYGARRQGIAALVALHDVTEVLPGASPNNGFREAMKRLAP